MKDAKGHGSNPRGSHQQGVAAIGQMPLWYHGSPTGHPGLQGAVHVGTAEAAKQALEARIGIPADGRGWDGSREYGKTLLAGKDTLARLAAAGYHGGYPETGYNCEVPKQDYYPGQRTERATFGDGSPVHDEHRPAVHAYNIVGAMSNDPGHPYSDSKANAIGKRKDLKRGIYYKNDGEDSGSVSAVVPSQGHLKEVP